MIALGGLALVAVVWLALHWGQSAAGWHWSNASELRTLLPWRAPRLVGAIAAGAMLAMAGTLLQRLTGNPMAAPEILGIGSGAALGLVALALLSSGESRVVQFGVCALGAAGALAIILLLGRRSAYAADRLLLTGIALGALLSVVVSIFMASNDPRIGELQIWMAGVTALINAPQAMFAALVAIVLLALTPLLRRWLDILPLGQEMPRALGLDVGRSRLLVLMVTALLTAAATLTAGPLGFVGLMAPHLVRLLGIQRTMPQMAAAALLGGLLMAVADWLARTVMFPYEMPAGLLATMLGGPYVMVLLMRRRSGSRA
jgi:iron complex transport system permease protein